MLMPGKMNIHTSTVLYIFTFLSIAKITDLITGVNSVIISFSKDYKFHMYFLLLLGAVNVILNYVFINEYGLIGAAAATCISYILFNVLKHLFVRQRFGFTLIFQDHWLVILIGFIIFAILYFLRFEFHPIINMVLKSLVTTILFLVLIWKFNPGDDIRNLINNSVNKYFGFTLKSRK